MTSVFHFQRIMSAEPLRLAVHYYRTPNPWFTPTHLYFAPHTLADPANHTVSWQSRRARKGRYTSKLSDVQNGDYGSIQMQARTSRVGSQLRPRLFSDVSFWIAFVFTFGSAIWVVNGEAIPEPG